MAFKFDVSSYDDVRTNSDKILRRLTKAIAFIRHLPVSSSRLQHRVRLSRLV
jgi:hypothetical protein